MCIRYVSTFGILFLGTPHDGGNKAQLASISRCMIEALVPSKIVDTEGQLLDALQEVSEALENITDMFVLLMKDFHFFFFFFWEQEKTNMGVTQDHVVEESSAAPILEQVFPMTIGIYAGSRAALLLDIDSLWPL